MATSIITEKELRLFSHDTVASNTLIDKVRWSPEDIEQAVINVIDYFNILTPPTSNSYTVESFPSRYLLVMGVWGYLLRGAAIGEASNHLSYSAAGVQIDDRDRASEFAQLGKMMWDEFTEKAQAMKLAQSINKVYGSKGSEYRFRSF
jgi:hypothetical protein